MENIGSPESQIEELEILRLEEATFWIINTSHTFCSFGVHASKHTNTNFPQYTTPRKQTKKKTTCRTNPKKHLR